MNIKTFIDTHYLHFNARSLRESAQAYELHLKNKGKMLVTLAGAMSTAELGKSLAEMIREDKVHAICCTGANLEESLFDLVAHDHYRVIPEWRDMTLEEETLLMEQGFNRVTDIAIPEDEAIRRLESFILQKWLKASAAKERFLPHEYFYQILDENYDDLKKFFQASPKDCWLIAAWKKRLPLFVPGWEDSTLGNIFVGHTIKGNLDIDTVKPGTYYMKELADWYLTNMEWGIGFFQIGGGIAGDFPICVVPMLTQDLEKLDIPHWSYFCQISDSTTSYGSYSGAIPREKITWGKLNENTPMFMIESDATIVAPLIFGYVLGW